MKKIFFVVLALVLFSDFANARFGGVRISRSFSRPSISRNYSRSATRSSAKPVVKTSTPKASQIKKQVAERPQKENPGHQASSGNLLPWIFYGHTISRSQSNGNLLAARPCRFDSGLAHHLINRRFRRFYSIENLIFIPTF